MNERIRQLAEQAEWSVRWGNPNNYEEYNRALDEWQEKFAELIVRECADQCTTDGSFCAEVVWGKQFNKKILKHFGVEYEEDIDETCPRCDDTWSGTSCGIPDCGWVTGVPE